MERQPSGRARQLEKRKGTLYITLRLVHRSCKRWFDWKLSSSPLEWELSSLRDKLDARNQDGSVRARDLTLQNLVVEGLFIDQLGAIAQSLDWVQVSEKQ